ncbi:MAG TPA: PilW family protein [Steroidobacteraceae bacterium]|nr:PilW family protein [Steroidobacteraceae bacterium]
MKTRNAQSGFSLIELLVAMGIGMFLIIGALTVQSNTRKTFTVNENQARLQETARYVFSVIEPELQLAGNYGYSNDASRFRLWISSTNRPRLADMRLWSTQVGSIPAILEQCGKHYAVDLMSAVNADNNSYTLACAAQGGGHNGISDTLTIRHAMQAASTASASKYQIQTIRTNPALNEVFMSGAVPETTTFIGDVQVRDMVVESYYVSVNSDARVGLPALRVKTLTTNGTSPVMTDQEVIRGVEDIQVEFGVDPGVDDDLDGKTDYTSGFTREYVAPNHIEVRNGAVSSARLCVRTRAEQAEQGFIDTKTYAYAGNTFGPFNDGFRRVVMCRTIYLRNARQFEYVP